MRTLRLIWLTTAIGAAAGAVLVVPSLRWGFRRDGSSSRQAFVQGRITFSWNPRRAEQKWPWHGWDRYPIHPALRWKINPEPPAAGTELIGGWRFLNLPVWPVPLALGALSLGMHLCDRRHEREAGVPSQRCCR